MKQPTSWAAAHVTPLFVLLVTIAVLMIGASDAWAYEAYSEGNDAGFCATCHGDFRLSPYTSPSGDSWNDDLHDVHRNVMLDGDCNACHTSGGRFPVLLDSSNGGDGLAPISCVGCHGRDEDIGNNTDRAAGLRQHHWNADPALCAVPGFPDLNCRICLDCHEDADPGSYTPVGEDVLPNYYANPGNNPDFNIPTDPCNPNGEEGAFGGSLLGLDNDGDSVYDTGDPDCGGSTGCLSDAECDNGQFCDGAETCNLDTGECQDGTAPCDPATETCDDVGDICELIPECTIDADCDNGLFCDGDETCDNNGICQDGTAPCDPATETCDDVGDICELIPECTIDADCDNGLFCDGDETCDNNGICQDGTAPCDPATETCNEDGDICELIPECTIDADCDNGLFCDGDETCDNNGICQDGTAPCDPATETCDEDGDICELIPECTIDADCDNGLFCDGDETCDNNGICQDGTAPCDPATETCNEDGDICELIPECTIDADCDNGLFCDGDETCNGEGICQAGTAPCDPATETCNEDGDICELIPECTIDADCDNGLFCDGDETCDNNGICQAGTAPCDPATETCDDVGDICELIPECTIDADCDNGLFCDGDETCDNNGICQDGTAPCDPATETCNEDGDICELIPECTIDADCDNGLFCDGDETCNGEGICQAGTAPCDPATETCNEDGDICELIPECTIDADCDNGLFCDGDETCDNNGICQDGTAPCDPATETCNEDGDICELIPECTIDADCDNGLFCDGDETCDNNGICQAGTAPCDPATETCDDVGDICELIPECTIDADCDNGLFCDGDETCDNNGICQDGTAPCNPATETCNEDGDICELIPECTIDADCDNGLFCDGDETCDNNGICQDGTAPCDPATETCDEAVNMCEPIEMLDLDVASLRVTKRVSLQRVKPVGITLVVKNTGTVEGTALATITGMQNGIEVYNETLTVTDAVGNGRTKYDDGSVPSIPPFVPTVEGDILWRATIADDDPDIDEVTAVTTVVP